MCQLFLGREPSGSAAPEAPPRVRVWPTGGDPGRDLGGVPARLARSGKWVKNLPGRAAAVERTGGEMKQFCKLVSGEKRLHVVPGGV
jgi:hypothetical protein